jgi:hypothetical protein
MSNLTRIKKQIGGVDWSLRVQPMVEKLQWWVGDSSTLRRFDMLDAYNKHVIQKKNEYAKSIRVARVSALLRKLKEDTEAKGMVFDTCLPLFVDALMLLGMLTGKDSYLKEVLSTFVDDPTQDDQVKVVLKDRWVKLITKGTHMWEPTLFQVMHGIQDVFCAVEDAMLMLCLIEASSALKGTTPLVLFSGYLLNDAVELERIKEDKYLSSNKAYDFLVVEHDRLNSQLGKLCSPLLSLEFPENLSAIRDFCVYCAYIDLGLSPTIKFDFDRLLLLQHEAGVLNAVLRELLAWPLLGDDEKSGLELSDENFRATLRRFLTKPKDFSARKLDGNVVLFEQFLQQVKKQFRVNTDEERKQVLVLVDSVSVDDLLVLFCDLFLRAVPAIKGISISDMASFVFAKLIRKEALDFFVHCCVYEVKEEKQELKLVSAEELKKASKDAVEWDLLLKEIETEEAHVFELSRPSFQAYQETQIEEVQVQPGIEESPSLTLFYVLNLGSSVPKTVTYITTRLALADTLKEICDEHVVSNGCTVKSLANAISRHLFELPAEVKFAFNNKEQVGAFNWHKIKRGSMRIYLRESPQGVYLNIQNRKDWVHSNELESKY